MLCVFEVGLYDEKFDDKDGIIDDVLMQFVMKIVDVMVRCVYEVEDGYRYVFLVVIVIIELYEQQQKQFEFEDIGIDQGIMDEFEGGEGVRDVFVGDVIRNDVDIVENVGEVILVLIGIEQVCCMLFIKMKIFDYFFFKK